MFAERLEDRNLLAADVMAFAAEVELVGVGRQDDGDTILAANRFNADNGLNEGVIFTVKPDGTMFEEVVGTFGEDTFLTAVSPNGLYVSGYSEVDDQTPFEGFLVEVATPSVLVGTGGLGPVPESFAFDVSDSAVVVGTTDGLSVPFRWAADSGLEALTESQSGGAQGISTTDVIVGYSLPAIGETRAVLFEGGTPTFLATPEGTDSLANDISPNSIYVGGFLSVDDLTTFETVDYAVVWENEALVRLQNADGSFFEGKVTAVSDNGYAVGESSDGSGFIWHESFVGVRMFDEWLQTEFSTTLPTSVRSISDVLYDGEVLSFAANGSSDYLITVDDPPTDASVSLPAGGGFFEVLQSGVDLIVRTTGGTELFRENAARLSSLTMAGSTSADTVTVVDAGGTVTTPLAFTGGAGDDLFDGTLAAGPLTLRGEADNDTLQGGAGDDLIQAGDGNDLVSGGAGRNELAGDGGLDTLRVTGNSLLQLTAAAAAGDGQDTHSGFEQAVLEAGSGNNRLDASAATIPVTLLGGAGQDTLLGGSQNDSLDGGAGTDFAEITGTNIVLTDATAPGFNGDTATSIEGLLLVAAGPDSVIDASGYTRGSVTIIGSSGADTLQGGAGDDLLLGGLGNDSLSGDAGDDWISGHRGRDTIDGGAGNDFILGGAQADELSGGTGSDTIFGGWGRDTIQGNADNDFISGGAGRDGINAGEGNDLVTGGGGQDTVLGRGGADTLRGEFGADILIGGDDDDSLEGGAGRDTLSGGNGNNETDNADEIDEAFTADMFPELLEV